MSLVKGSQGMTQLIPTGLVLWVMPRLRLYADGNQLRHQVLGGRAQIVQYDLKPCVLVYRQLIKGTKWYISRQLNSTTQQAALR